MTSFGLRPLLIVAAAFMVLQPPANAQEAYPSKPVRIIVPFPAGGVADIMARLVGDRLSQAFKQPFLVENRAGASAIIGSELVAKAPADGYTLLLANLPVMAINPIAFTNLPYDPVRDFAPITMIADQPYIIAVSTALPVTNMKELIALGRKRPGQITFGSASSSTQLAGELFAMAAKIEMTHVP